MANMKKPLKNELDILRKNLNMFQGSQSDAGFAERLGLKLEYLLSLKVSNRVNPTIRTLSQIATKMGCTISELFDDLE